MPLGLGLGLPLLVFSEEDSVPGDLPDFELVDDDGSAELVENAGGKMLVED